MDQPVHEVIKITAVNGRKWCLDVSGGQYGFTQPLRKWADYKRDHVERIVRWPSVEDRCEADLRSGDKHIITEALQRREIAQILSKYVNGMLGRMGAIIDGAEDPGDSNVDLFLRRWRRSLKGFVKHMNSDDERVKRQCEVRKLVKEHAERGWRF
jgi:hypothetical protein